MFFFISNDVVTGSLKSSRRIIDKNINVIRELLEKTRVYYCFYSKVGNFKVKCQKLTKRQRQNVCGQSMGLKIACSNIKDSVGII